MGLHGPSESLNVGYSTGKRSIPLLHIHRNGSNLIPQKCRFTSCPPMTVQASGLSTPPTAHDCAPPRRLQRDHKTRDNTTVYDEAANSALDIDYDAITVAPLYAQPQQPPIPIHTPISSVPPRASWALARTCADRDVAVMVTTAKRAALRVASVTMVVIVSAQDSGGVGAENALNMSTSPLPPPVSFPPGSGPAKGRNNLVEKLVREHREEC